MESQAEVAKWEKPNSAIEARLVMIRAMPCPTAIAAYWKRFSAATGNTDSTRFYDVAYFGDSEALANALADLVLKGIKRATAGSLASFEHEGKRPPRPGDFSIITNWAGAPLCVIETTRVDVVPFDQVTAEFAATEGEGDGSLEYWRAAHTAFFSRECARIGEVFSESMLIACELFHVVYLDTESGAFRRERPGS